MNIPKNKAYPSDSVQCDDCGGHGCETCEGKGWLTPKDHPKGRKCHRLICTNTIPPEQVSVYCSNTCTYADAEDSHEDEEIESILEHMTESKAEPFPEDGEFDD